MQSDRYISMLSAIDIKLCFLFSLLFQFSFYNWWDWIWRLALLVQGVIGFCLAIQPTDGDMGTIGRKIEYFPKQSAIYHLTLKIHPWSLNWWTICRELHDRLQAGIWLGQHEALLVTVKLWVWCSSLRILIITPSGPW